MTWTEVGLKRTLTDWWHDPQRRKQVCWRIVESLVGLLIVAFLGWKWIPVAVLAEWLVYEFILEPLGLAGPYWERIPAAGTTFIYW